MIEYFELRKSNNEKVLILYLSYDYEFSSDFNKSSILNRINNFIKDNKIKWNGNKIILVVGGLVLGTLVLGPINQNKKATEQQFNYVSKIILNHYDEFNNELGYSNIEPVINNNAIINNEEKQEQPNIKEPNTNNTVITTSPSIKKEPVINNLPKEEIKDNKIIVTIHRSNGTIEEIELEEYVTGVVAIEMPASFNIEALRAQSIAARTYALKAMQEETILTDDTSTQAYKDTNQLKELWGEAFDLYYEKIKKAVNDTKGLVLTYNDEYISALYHSTSNGYTENSYEVFGYSYPYLITVDSIWDMNASSYLREKTFSFEELSNILQTDITDDSIIEIVSKTNSGRVSRVKINDNYYSGIELRNLLGLRSADFDIGLDNDKVIIKTKGYGHGVGMSQYGANGMANSGKNYKEILNHYYPGTKLKTV